MHGPPSPLCPVSRTPWGHERPTQRTRRRATSEPPSTNEGSCREEQEPDPGPGLAPGRRSSCAWPASLLFPSRLAACRGESKGTVDPPEAEGTGAGPQRTAGESAGPASLMRPGAFASRLCPHEAGIQMAGGRPRREPQASLFPGFRVPQEYSVIVWGSVPAGGREGADCARRGGALGEGRVP